MQENPLVNFAKFSNQFPYYSFIQFPTNLKLETFSSNSSMLSQRLSRKDPISRFDIFLFAPSRATKFRNCAHLNFSRRRETKKPTPSHPFISCTFDLYATELLPPTCSSFHTFVGATFLQFNDPGSEGGGGERFRCVRK